MNEVSKIAYEYICENEPLTVETAKISNIKVDEIAAMVSLNITNIPLVLFGNSSFERINCHAIARRLMGVEQS